MKLAKAPKDVKVAIIHEAGPYGTGGAVGNEQTCTRYGTQILLKEGYSAIAPDCSTLVTKLRRKVLPARQRSVGTERAPLTGG